MNNLIEARISAYEQNSEYVRHHQNQRATLATIVLTLTAGLTGLITFDQKISYSDRFSAIFIMIISLYGIFFCVKHHKRFWLYKRNAEAHLKSIDPQLIAIEKNTIAEHSKMFIWGLISKGVKVWVLWSILYIFIFCFGVYLFSASLDDKPQSKTNAAQQDAAANP